MTAVPCDLKDDGIQYVQILEGRACDYLTGFPLRAHQTPRGLHSVTVLGGESHPMLRRLSAQLPVDDYWPEKSGSSFQMDPNATRA